MHMQIYVCVPTHVQEYHTHASTTHTHKQYQLGPSERPLNHLNLCLKRTGQPQPLPLPLLYPGYEVSNLFSHRACHGRIKGWGREACHQEIDSTQSNPSKESCC